MTAAQVAEWAAVQELIGALTERGEALLAERDRARAECVGLADALGDPNVTHDFAPMHGLGICGAEKDEDSYCALPSTAAVHRTPGRVHAELEAGA